MDPSVELRPVHARHDLHARDAPSPSPSQTTPTRLTSETEAADESNAAIAYPPLDRGTKAWRLLLVAFVYETLLWGFPLSFGVFEAYYSRLPQFNENGLVSLIGTVASGLSYLAAPIAIPLVSRFAHYRRYMIFVGWPVCLLGLVAGSFAQTLPTLIITQGVMYGLGFVTFYYPILSMVNEYWVRRRGMAYGLLCSASGLSGAAMPFAVQVLLERYGYPFTLRAIAIGLAVLTAPLMPFLRGRDAAAEQTLSQSADWSFLGAARFWVFTLANLAMSLAYFFPALYLPSYAISNGLSSSQGALLLAVMSISQVLGQFSFGYLSDHRLPVEVLIISSTLVAAMAAYVCWGFAHTLPVMVVFALIWGFTGTGFTALWARIGSSISSDPHTAFTAYGTLNVGKGLANVLAGVIGSALIGGKIVDDAYGTLQYEKLILFTGSGMLVSCAIVLIYGLRHCKSWVLVRRESASSN